MPSKHKAAAVDFLERVASGEVRATFKEYVSPGFRHHNAWFKSDAESLLTAMEKNAKDNPEKKLVVHQVLEEGDRVAVYSHVKHKPDERGAALMHIFRFEGDKIAELWDMGMEIPAESPNQLGMF